MLAATLTTVVVFFPVTFLYGVSRFLFTALALAVVLSLFASYVVAMTVVPLFCARFINGHRPRGAPERACGERFNAWFNRGFDGMLDGYDRPGRAARCVASGCTVVVGSPALFVREPGCSTRCSAWPSSRAPTPASS